MMLMNDTDIQNAGSTDDTTSQERKDEVHKEKKTCEQKSNESTLQTNNVIDDKQDTSKLVESAPVLGSEVANTLIIDGPRDNELSETNSSKSTHGAIVHDDVQYLNKAAPSVRNKHQNTTNGINEFSLTSKSMKLSTACSTGEAQPVSTLKPPTICKATNSQNAPGTTSAAFAKPKTSSLVTTAKSSSASNDTINKNVTSIRLTKPVNNTKSNNDKADTSNATLRSNSFNDWLSIRKGEWKRQRNQSKEGTNKDPLKNDDKSKKTSNNNARRSGSVTTSSTTDNSKKFIYVSAASFGLPDGWTVRIQPRSRYTFRSPTGQLFHSKKKLCEFLGIDVDLKTPSATVNDAIRNKMSGKSKVTRVYERSNDGGSIAREPVSLASKETKHGSLKGKTRKEGEANDVQGTAQVQNIPKTIVEKRNRSLIEFEKKHQDSLSNVIVKLKKAQEKIESFGPIPWEGCQIVKGPPAPALLGLQIQALPSKFGIGIASVEEYSPFRGKVGRGDIITHYMDMPLNGICSSEFKRLLFAEDKKERLLHIAPRNFNFSHLIMQNKIASACETPKKSLEQKLIANDSSMICEDVNPTFILENELPTLNESKIITGTMDKDVDMGPGDSGTVVSPKVTVKEASNADRNSRNRSSSAIIISHASTNVVTKVTDKSKTHEHKILENPGHPNEDQRKDGIGQDTNFADANDKLNEVTLTENIQNKMDCNVNLTKENQPAQSTTSSGNKYVPSVSQLDKVQGK